MIGIETEEKRKGRKRLDGKHKTRAQHKIRDKTKRHTKMSFKRLESVQL